MERKFKRFHHLTYTDRLKIEQMYNGGAGDGAPDEKARDFSP